MSSTVLGALIVFGCFVLLAPALAALFACLSNREEPPTVGGER